MAKADAVMSAALAQWQAANLRMSANVHFRLTAPISALSTLRVMLGHLYYPPNADLRTNPRVLTLLLTPDATTAELQDRMFRDSRELAERVEASDESRKRLVEQTKEFRKGASEVRSRVCLARTWRWETTA